MKSFLLFLLLIPLTASAQVKEGYCKEGSTYEMHECAFKKLIQSDKELKKSVKQKTFKNWVLIRQKMCSEEYSKYKNGAIYPLFVMRCSINMNKVLLKKMGIINR